MKRHVALLVAGCLGWGANGMSVRGAEPDPKLVKEGYGFLLKYCKDCHGIRFEKKPLDVTRSDILFGHELKKKNGPRHYLVKGKPDESFLWQRVEEGSMPPPDRVPDQPTEDEKKTFRAWIEAGAPIGGPEKRAFKSEKSVLTDIVTHLLNTSSNDLKFQRYFVLTNLYNNKNVTEADFRLYRAALSKLINSLSWKEAIVIPKAIDAEKTVYNIDLRQLGWERQRGTRDVWTEILTCYPYGLSHATKPEELQELADKVYRFTGTDVPYIRADWFIATASQAPLYYTILDLPKHARDLEKRLKVNVEENFLNDNLFRAGVTTSGVSKHNRLLERHAADYGAYWKSYDFESSGGLGNLLRYPLGPKFDRNNFNEQAFVQSGGEIIFNLPNRLQGYMLVNHKDERIDKAPIEIVRDLNEAAGFSYIINGLSCMSCHSHGMLGNFKDVLRTGTGVHDEALVKVGRLHPTPEKMNALLKEDEERFMTALAKCTKEFLLVGEDEKKDLAQFPDPIGLVAKRYFNRDLDIADVASELDIEDPKTVEGMVRGNRNLKELGLGPLSEGASIKREVWEFYKDHISLFQLVAREIGFGTPVGR
jgi:serine/threonine-protein kinase